MKKNIFELFLDKFNKYPLLIKQILYTKLRDEMNDFACKDLIDNHQDDIFSIYVPTITFKGRTELSERQCGLDNNMYNFLQYCLNNYSIIEIAVNMFLSVEEVAKYFVLCMEQNFVKIPESKELKAMAEFLSGKLRLGEYFKHIDKINVDQLQQAILKHRDEKENGKTFGEILLNLNLITKDELKPVVKLKTEAKKRIILDSASVPPMEMAYTNEAQKFEEEIEKLKEENAKLKRNMLQILELVKNNV